MVSLGTAVGYAVLLVWAVLRRSWDTWQLRALLLYLALSVLLSVSFSLTVWSLSQVSKEAPSLGLRLMGDLLTVLSPVLVMLTLWFLERPGPKWVAIVGMVWVLLVLAVDFNLLDLQRVIMGASAANSVDLVQSLRVAGWAGFSAGTLLLVAVDFFQTRRPLHRNRILFWLLGLSLTLGGELLMWLKKGVLIDVNQIGAALRFMGVIALTVATISYYLPVLRSFARQALIQVLILALTTLVISALIFGGIRLVLTIEEWRGVLLLTIEEQRFVLLLEIVTAVTAAVVLALILQPLRLLVSRVADRIVYSGHYNPARALRDYGDAINNIVDLNALSTVAVGMIAEALDVRRGVLMLISLRDNLIYDVVVLESMGALATNFATLTAASPILIALRDGKKPLTQYEIDILPEYRAAPPYERAWLHSLEMEVYVPIRERDNLAGVFAFGRKESGEPYSTQDLDVLMTIGNQTVAVLQNARLVTDLRTANVSITELNLELTESNQRLEKLDKAKTDFIEIASHELRTPLTQVRGYSDILTDMMQQGTIVPAHMNQISQGITRASIRLEQIISAMLDVSRIDAQALDIRTAAISVSVAVKMAIDNYKEAIRDRKMNVQVHDLDDLPSIQGDLQRLCQAFGNIIGNAIKYTPDGGTITISGRTLEEPTNAHPHKVVEVVFADSGIGIDPSDRDLIFEKFYRVGAVELHSTGSTKFKGAGPGLGLPIARGVIQAHGGKIWVESPGHDEEHLPGSTFYIVLPVASPVPAPAASPAQG